MNIQLHTNVQTTPAIRQCFLKRLIDKAPFKISKILTDNGKEFTDWFCAMEAREPTCS
jgi:hypothetical protein